MSVKRSEKSMVRTQIYSGKWVYLLASWTFTVNISILKCTGQFFSGATSLVKEHFADTVDPWTTEFELWRSTYVRIFFSSKFYNSTPSEIGRIHWYRAMDSEEPHIWRASSKLYSDFQLGGGWVPLTPHIVWDSNVHFSILITLSLKHILTSWGLK